MYSLTNISETLFVPMCGRIYASEHFPKLFYDAQALKLKSQIPEKALKFNQQSQYTFMASVSRCKNIDNSIKNFLKENPYGIIIELGCGLETTYFRTDNGRAQWYELDLPEVIEFREKFIPMQERMTFIKSSVFDKDWIDNLNKSTQNQPVLFIAGGLFHYFEQNNVIKLLQNLCKFSNAQIVFDTVSRLGMKGTKKYMKKMGHDSAKMYFYCNKAELLAAKISSNVRVIEERDFYKCIDKTDMNFITQFFMRVSDLMHMVKIIELKLS